jgi:plasmid rolling circle replication initiator protein Rep
MPENIIQASENQSTLGLSDLSSKDKPWDKQRGFADTVQELYQGVGYEKYSDRIDSCSKLLQFAFCDGEEGDKVLKLFSARFCRVRLCPVCQWRRSLMWVAKFCQALPAFLGDFPKTRFLFLTLTIRNCELSELRSTVAHMNKSWERLSKRKIFPAFASVRSLEVTRGADGSAHPHFHCILAVRPSYFSTGYISHQKWVELWQKSLRVEYSPVVSIEAIKIDKNKGIGGIIKPFREVLKYSVKSSDLVYDTDWLKELTNQLHKTRAISIAGEFKQYLSDEEPEDLIKGEDSEVNLDEVENTLSFGWRETVKKYLLND